MARRTTFKLSGVRTWVDNIKNEVSQEAARNIVLDLKEKGPYWSGDFEEAWIVKLGDARINATKQGVPQRPTSPYRRQITPFVVPAPSGRKSITYTIGNEMVYRNIAMDLEPGRLKVGPGTAPGGQDWFRKYVEGGEMRTTLARSTNRATQAPRVKGFKGPA